MGLDDVAAGTEHDLLVLGPEADLALEHDRVLVLARVEMGRDERPDRERVLDDRERATGVGRLDLEHDADTRCEPARPPLAGVDDLDTGGRRGEMDGHRVLLRVDSMNSAV
jgi:hypothetical protein